MHRFITGLVVRGTRHPCDQAEGRHLVASAPVVYAAAEADIANSRDVTRDLCAREKTPPILEFSLRLAPVQVPPTEVRVLEHFGRRASSESW